MRTQSFSNAYLDHPIIRRVAIGLMVLCLGISLLYVFYDDEILGEEPPPFSIITGESVFVDDGECSGSQIKEVIGGDVGVERTRRCVLYPYHRILASRLLRSVTMRFGKIYAVLAVIGTVAAGLAVVLAAARYVRR